MTKSNFAPASCVNASGFHRGKTRIRSDCREAIIHSDFELLSSFGFQHSSFIILGHSVLEVRPQDSYFQGMKRLFLFVLLAVSVLQFTARAQESTAAEIAEKQAAEERYKRLSADVESLLAANVALQKKISALESELQNVREEQLRNANKNNNEEAIKKLADAIQEVDKNREGDKKMILEEIAKLGKTITAPAPRSKPSVSSEPNPGPDKGYPYVIQAGDTLSAILADFNAQFKAKGMKTVRLSQVMAANPNVEWTRLQVGQKIFIPAPE